MESSNLVNERKDDVLSKGKTRKNLAPWIFILPAILIITIFVLLPTVAGIVLSFFKYDAIGSMDFVGFSQYKGAFGDGLFRHSMWVTFLYAFGSLIPTVFISLLLA